MAARAVWTADRIKILTDLWPTKTSRKGLARMVGVGIESCRAKAHQLGLKTPARIATTKRRRHDYYSDTPIAEMRCGMLPETAAQSAIWAGVEFTDHPAATRPEGKLRGLPDSARSMIGCAAALAASN